MNVDEANANLYLHLTLPAVKLVSVRIVASLCEVADQLAETTQPGDARKEGIVKGKSRSDKTGIKDTMEYNNEDLLVNSRVLKNSSL